MSVFFHSTLTDPVWDQLVFQVEVPRVHLVSVHISGHVSVSEDHLIPECTSSWFPEAHTSVCGCWLWNSSIHCVNVNRFYLKPCQGTAADGTVGLGCVRVCVLCTQLHSLRLHLRELSVGRLGIRCRVTDLASIGVTGLTPPVLCCVMCLVCLCVCRHVTALDEPTHTHCL